MQCSMCSVHCAFEVCNEHLAVCSVPLVCIVCVGKCAVCSVQCTVYNVQCAYTSGSHYHCHCHLADSLQTLLGLLLLALPTAKDQSKIKARAT